MSEKEEIHQWEKHSGHQTPKKNERIESFKINPRIKDGNVRDVVKKWKQIDMF